MLLLFSALTDAVIVSVTCLICTHIGNNGNNAAQWNPIVFRNKQGAYGLPILDFEPEEDYTGEFGLVVFAWSGVTPAMPKDRSIGNITFTVKVRNPMLFMPSYILHSSLQI